jgi:hypothetical protein
VGDKGPGPILGNGRRYGYAIVVIMRNQEKKIKEEKDEKKTSGAI